MIMVVITITVYIYNLQCTTHTIVLLKIYHGNAFIINPNMHTRNVNEHGNIHVLNIFIEMEEHSIEVDKKIFHSRGESVFCARSCGIQYGWSYTFTDTHTDE